MKQVKLGANSTTVSCIGIGAMSFSDFYGPTTEENSHAILHRALEAGVTHLDTANVYGMGRSEKAIGAFLRDHPAARDVFHIASKAGIARTESGERYFDNSPAYLEAQLDASLKRLGVDCLDLFYVHRRDADTPIEEVTQTLAGLIKKGKIRAFGFSEIAPTSLRRAQAVHPVAAVQSEYSLSTRAPELGLLQACAELDVTLVAFSPVGRSLLSDNPLQPQDIQGLGFLESNPRFQAPNHAANLKSTEGFRTLSAEMGVPAAGLAMAWLLHRGDHVLPIPGTRSVTHLNELLAGADVSLDYTDLSRIEAVLPVGWCHGDRYSADQWVGPERYC